jgi:hypothetical protein
MKWVKPTQESLDMFDDLLLEEIREKMLKYPTWHAYGLSGITISSLLILVFRSLGWIAPYQFP